MRRRRSCGRLLTCRRRVRRLRRLLVAGRQQGALPVQLAGAGGLVLKHGGDDGQALQARTVPVMSPAGAGRPQQNRGASGATGNRAAAQHAHEGQSSSSL